MRTINIIIVHCSATPPQWAEHQPHNLAMVEAIRAWHKARGFNDIGYHEIITPDGTRLPGRSWYLPGAHTRGENKDSLGVCYIGGLDSQGRPADTRTPEQIRSLDRLLAVWRSGFGSHITIHGHNEFANKACPSFDVQKDEERRYRLLLARYPPKLRNLERNFLLKPNA